MGYEGVWLIRAMGYERVDCISFNPVGLGRPTRSRKAPVQVNTLLYRGKLAHLSSEETLRGP